MTQWGSANESDTSWQKQAFVFPTYNRTSWRDDAIGEKLYYSDWQQQGSWAVEVLRKVVIFSSLNRMKRRVRRRRKIRFPYKTIIWKENVLYCQLEMHAFVVFYAPVGMQPRATWRLRLLISMGSFHSIKSPVGPSLAGRGVPMKCHRQHIMLEVVLIGILKNFQIICE